MGVNGDFEVKQFRSPTVSLKPNNIYTNDGILLRRDRMGVDLPLAQMHRDFVLRRTRNGLLQFLHTAVSNRQNRSQPS